MIKLLVTSTITMSEEEFFEYARHVEERCKELPRDKFAGTLLSGKSIKATFPDGTKTTYEVINWLN